MSNFQEDLKFGQIAEAEFFLTLAKAESTVSLLDVSKDPYYQSKDIDILVQRKDGVIVKYEVKSDRKADETGNICFETSSNGNEGCLQRSEADYIFYKTEKHNYLFSLKDMREFLRTHPYGEYEMGDGAKGYLLNLEDLKLARVLKEV